MTTIWKFTLALAALAAASIAATAQTGVVPAAGAASASPAAQAGPRRMTLTEVRESATMPGDLRPANGVTPQIVIPLRKGAGPGGPARRAAVASAGIDDSAARCDALSARRARERCLKAHSKPTPGP